MTAFVQYLVPVMMQLFVASSITLVVDRENGKAKDTAERESHPIKKKATMNFLLLNTALTRKKKRKDVDIADRDRNPIKNAKNN